jgi:hypothetical protein
MSASDARRNASAVSTHPAITMHASADITTMPVMIVPAWMVCLASDGRGIT